MTDNNNPDEETTEDIDAVIEEMLEIEDEEDEEIEEEDDDEDEEDEELDESADPEHEEEAEPVVAEDVEDPDDEEDDAEDDDEEDDEDEGYASATSAVDAEEDDDEDNEKAPKMSDKKKKSMSDHVRAEIARRQEAGASLRGVDIIQALAKRSINVSAAQVSQLLKKEGVSSKSRNPRRTKIADSEKTIAAAPAEERSRAANSVRKTFEREPTRSAVQATLIKEIVAASGVDALEAVDGLLQACDGNYARAALVLHAHQLMAHDRGPVRAGKKPGKRLPA